MRKHKKLLDREYIKLRNGESVYTIHRIPFTFPFPNATTRTIKRFRSKPKTFIYERFSSNMNTSMTRIIRKTIWRGKGNDKRILLRIIKRPLSTGIRLLIRSLKSHE